MKLILTEKNVEKMFLRRIERIMWNEFITITYDITTAIVHGENVFGVELGMDGITKKIN